MVIKCCNKASYTSVFGNYRYWPPIATINKAPVLRCYNRISYTNSFKSAATSSSIIVVFKSIKKKTLH